MLKVEDLHVYYDAIHAIKGVTFEVGEGEIVTLIGANGAGKTTTLHAISGLLKPKSGSITFMGQNLLTTKPHMIVRSGLAQVPEGRRVFSELTVQENLEMGAYIRKDKAGVAADYDMVFERLPRLKERRKQLAGTLSGGAKGLSGIPASTNFSWAYWVMILSVFVIFAFIKSRHGRAVISIREDEIAAEASGIRTTYYKMMAFVLAAFFAGIAGGLYAHHVGVLAPTKFDFNYSVEFLVMVVLGGMGSITGSIIAAIVLTILPEALRGFEDYRMLLYSLVLIVMMLFRPTGLLGTYEFSLSRMLNRPRKAAIKEGGKQA